jgi:hypothetical protein
MTQKALPKGFIRMWYAWQHSPEPVSNFRHRRVDAPTYRIEHDLDHLASGVYELCTSVIAGRWEHARVADEELAELEELSRALEGCPISQDEKNEFRRYMSVTRMLLEELRHVCCEDAGDEGSKELP